MTAYRIDPLQDPRWEEFVQTQPRASIFHSPGWLEALRRTYGYEPIVFTTSLPTSQLANGIAFCRVKSWLTGSRLVSVPFADHCQPLVSSGDELQMLVGPLQADFRQKHYTYIEFRPLSDEVLGLDGHAGLKQSASFYYHSLDLRPDLDALFRGLHPSCVQRKIRRAEKEGVACEEGASDSVLQRFYSLLLLTRRRHGLPPQPFAWFRNLRDCLGNRLKIRIASKNGQPIASVLTLRYKNRMVYKYGCSDARFHRLGAMPLLFWRTIQEAKETQADELDLGRSDLQDTGLIGFKNHLGAVSSTLNYYRYPPESARSCTFRISIVPKLVARLPGSFLRVAGKFLYRHVG